MELFVIVSLDVSLDPLAMVGNLIKTFKKENINQVYNTQTKSRVTVQYVKNRNYLFQTSFKRLGQPGTFLGKLSFGYPT